MDSRSPLQPFQTALGPGDDRPADRFGHGVDVRPPVGGDDDRRRKLRRGLVLFPAQNDGRGAVRHAVVPAHAPGARRGERDLLGAAQGGRHRAGQLALRHHEGAHRIPPLPRRGLHDRRRGRHAARTAVQRRDGPCETRKGPRRKPARKDSVRGAHRHQQHGRRPTRVDAQHPRNGRTVPPLRRAPADGLGALRRERLLHQNPRGGLRLEDDQGDRPRNVRLGRHYDHLGQEGRRGEHGRLRGDALRGTLQKGDVVQHHVRRLRHLRRHVGPRHGRAGRGTGREHGIRTARRPHPAGAAAGRPAGPVRRPLPASGRRARDLRGCEEGASEPPEGAVHRPDAGRGTLPRSGHPRRGDRLDPRRPRPRDAREPLPRARTAAPGHPAPRLHRQPHPGDRRRMPQHLRAPRGVTTGYRITFEAPILRHFTVELDKIR